MTARRPIHYQIMIVFVAFVACAQHSLISFAHQFFIFVLFSMFFSHKKMCPSIFLWFE